LILFLLTAATASAQYSTQDSVLIWERTQKAYDYAFNNPDTGLILARELIADSRAINYAFGEAHAYLFLADCYLSKGDYARTIYHLLTARTICAENGITGLDQRINRPFGELYIALGKPEKAVVHQLKALQKSTEPQETAIVTKGLAEAYYEVGKLDSALFYAEPLFEIAGTLWSATGVTLGRIYSRLGRHEEALNAFRTRAGLTYDLDLVGNYFGRAVVFRALGQIDSTRFYARQALELAQENQFYKYINEASTLLAETYEENDREQYLGYLLISYAAKDSLYSREKMNQINNYIFADETRRRDLAAAELRFASQKRVLMLIALSAILLTVGLLLWRNNAIKTRSNTLLRNEKRKLEDAMEQLRTTQSQLIEAEKTARRLEVQEAERLRELDQVKTRLYTNITHEFRTPLTVIMGMNDNISGYDQERSLIRRNAKNLLQLINQLLDLSKLDSGTLKTDVIQGDIIAYLQYLAESFYSMASDKKVNLSFRSEQDQLIMDFDEAKVQHMVYNLLSNAIKFTRPGGKVAMEVNTTTADDQEFLQLIVKDTGNGISEKDLPHIFDRFYQVEQHPQTLNGGGTFAGTGIGLAFVKELVELLNGRIAVKSEIGWGTEFTILLPVEKKASTPALAVSFESGGLSGKEFTPAFEHLPASPDQISGDKPHVLLIEDHAGVISYVKTLLTPDYFVQVAINGQEGIDLALEHLPDLIITDVMMPEKNGYEVCQILKQDMRTSHIPIVMLTAKADLTSRIEGLKTGADAYLAKPFEKEELLVRLRKLLELRISLQQHYTSQFPASNSEDATPSLEDQFLEKIRKEIEARMEDVDLTIPDLCRLLNLSHIQLYRKLKALTGKTPSQFINTIRLERARQLLQNAELNVSEVAYRVGFNDPNYFSRVFKKEFGVTPGEFGGGN
jgi:signal transduction histidine kinase/DNA-binding response OmpR family regulator